jgi:hypothetical protein
VTDPRQPPNRRSRAFALRLSSTISPGVRVWITERVPSISALREHLRRTYPTPIITIQGTMPPTRLPTVQEPDLTYVLLLVTLRKVEDCR